MGFNVIEASERIEKKYRRYLTTTFNIADPEYMDLLDKALDGSTPLYKGPYLDVTDSFEQGKSVRELVEGGVLSRDFENVSDIYGKRLYAHQETAVEKILGGRNVVVSTGTGSGKTECFLIPIFESLMREREASPDGKISPGVRALLIYPMNALANDQVERLRRSLKDYPYITFGCYTGQTESHEDKAIEQYRKLHYDPATGEGYKPLDNEILSRDKMKENPPHILITNYAMLEYLMLRPEDSVFFDGEYAHSWKYIVLDEAHTYSGSTGIEVSMLLRRVMAKLSGPKVQYILTSATIGEEGMDDEVSAFGEKLCNAPFDPRDVVRARRVSPESHGTDRDLGTGFYAFTASLMDDGLDDAAIIKGIKGRYTVTGDESSLSSFLYDAIIGDETYFSVKNYMDSPKDVEDICDHMGWDKKTLSDFVTVCSHAVKGRTKLFDARYHLFIRATDGVYVTLPPHKALFTEKRTSAFFDGEEFTAYEAVTCSQCHALYIMGSEQGGYLEQAAYIPDSIREAYLVGDTVNDSDEDETLEGDNLKTEHFLLCPRCGLIQRGDSVKRKSCGHPSSDYVKLVKVKTSERTGRVTKCICCEGSNSLGVLRGFFSGQEASTSVIGTSLFEELPGHKTVVKESTGEDDYGFGPSVVETKESVAKQFIAFSDNRQAAAYFSTYFSETYDGMLYGRLLNDRVGGEKRPIPRLAGELRKSFSDRGIARFGESSPNYEAEAWKAILKELVDNRSRTSLMGLGLVGLEFSDDVSMPGNDQLNLSSDDLINICLVYILGMMSDIAIHYDEKIGITEKDREFFAHDRPELTYVVNGANSALIRSFIPQQRSVSTDKSGSAKKTNRRADYLARIFKKKGVPFDDGKICGVLKSIWEKLFMGNGLLTNETTKDGVMGYRVNLDKICLTKPGKWYRCTRCHRLTPHNVAGVCPTYKCDGELEPVDIEEINGDDHYFRLYSDLEPTPLRVVEHTAQLDRDTAYRYQNMFKDKKIDVLSCSTTFELGVDVGELETVFMRNMPPSPANYAQRAGRAGRNIDSAAFALTFCNRSNHDFNFFKDPVSMIKGVINPPAFNTENGKIGIRHVYSSALAFFWRRYPEYFKDACRMMEEGEYGRRGYDLFGEYLKSRPQDLKGYLLDWLPAPLAEEFDVERFGWVKWLFDEPDMNYPCFKNAYELYASEIGALEKAFDSAVKNGNPSDYIRNTINNYRKENVISFLSKNGILPKYGFPVDTVQLMTGGDRNRNAGLDLSRDLSMAISEYAPGCQVVADGKLITSRYIRKIPEEHWKMYDYVVCDECRTLVTELHTDDSKTNLPCNCPQCKRELGKHETFLIPDFGFIAERRTKTPTLVKPERTYRTETSFVCGNEPSEEISLELGGVGVSAAVMNKGPLASLSTGEFYVCQKCGYALNSDEISAFTPSVNRYHSSPQGLRCGCGKLDRFSLGYRFETDVIRIKIGKLCEYDEAYSVLQALILAACDLLGLDDGEIGGCLQYYALGGFYFILYDTTPGGAGHVKRLYREKALADVLHAAYRRAKECTCGNEEGDSSCYSCLRTYQNQKYHDVIKRKYVISYLDFAKERE